SADAAGAGAVLDGDDELVPGSEAGQGGIDRDHPARIDDGDADALVFQDVGGLEARLGEHPRGDDEHVEGEPAAAAQQVHAVDADDGVDVRPGGGLREAQDGRPVADLHG